MISAQLPDPDALERLLQVFERNPFATQSLILLAAVVAFAIYVYRRR